VNAAGIRVPARLPLVIALLLTLMLAMAGCVSLPESGPVKASPAEDQADQQASFDFNPGGPKRGATPVDIVNGFLTAMQATPLTTFVARQFLTTASGGRWVPERGTVVYGSHTMTQTATQTTTQTATQTATHSKSGVGLRLQSVTELDRRGEWLGDPTDGKGIRYDLKLVKEKGQWRISNPPNRLVVPQSHFDTRFQQYFLYFFDQSGQVLVPEPVYLPSGAQAPTLLVAGLLRGPDKDLSGVERTFIPARTKLGDISVPVSRDGVADVPLSDDMLDLKDRDLNLAFAQLAWTLSQQPGIDRMRVTIDGSPIDLPGDSSDVSVTGWSEFDPAVAWASQALFGLRDGRAVEISADHEQRVPGVFGSRDFSLRSIAVDLSGEQMAGVADDSRKVLVAPRGAPPEGSPSKSAPAVVYSGGTDVLQPAWDIYGQLWLIDQTEAGAVLAVVRNGVANAVQAPGITGKDVRAFVLSRDGTRLVAEEQRRHGDRLVVARIQRAHSGRVHRVNIARRLPFGGPKHDIRALAWRTPGSVAVLAGPTLGTSQVVVIKVDGSSALDDTTTDPEMFRDQAINLVTSPATGAPLYIGMVSGRLFELAANGRWVGTGIKAGLGSPTFVG
jgi:Lipoprotein LpqB beta-propeller domain/Sporulation and spore germination